MAYYGAAGHLLIDRGSIFARSTNTADLNAFSSTHLTHTGLDGDIYAEGDLEIDGTAYFDGDAVCAKALSTTALSPAEITANTDDWAVNTNSFVRYTADGEYDLTGIVAGLDGQRLVLVNIGANKVTIKDQDGSSVAANRFLTNTGGDLELTQDEVAEMIYDAQTARWRVWEC
jgi:hypothetical protein